MNRLVEEKRQQLERVCCQRHVRRIDLSGSATGSGFDPAKSDLDFLVAFRILPSINTRMPTCFSVRWTWWWTPPSRTRISAKLLSPPGH